MPAVPEERPRWSPEDPGDSAPLGIGCRNADVETQRLRVLRDVYYIAEERGPRDQFVTPLGLRDVDRLPRSNQCRLLGTTRRCSIDAPPCISCSPKISIFPWETTVR